jgi:4-amino-4-deoxychorismate lyase
VESPLRDPDARLIETLRWNPETGFARRDAHLARLADGARRLGVPLCSPGVVAALATVRGPGPLRVRLLVDSTGAALVETSPAPALAEAWRVVIASVRLRSDDPWLQIKTTRRPIYDAARAALPQGVDEAILLNERGEVCDGTITSVFLDRGGLLLTPPRACGLLPGVLRGALLASGAAREATLRPEDLDDGRLMVGNSLRGLIPARRQDEEVA